MKKQFRKNGFLTFVFACFPGTGQMYYGYMQRGLSLMLLFFLLVGISGWLLGPLVALLPVVWVYSFFDTYDLIHRAEDGVPREDALLFVSGGVDWKKYLPGGNKTVGWGLVAVGVWIVCANILGPILESLLDAIGMSGYYFVRELIPTIVVAGLLIFCGIWLVRGGLGAKPAGEEIPPYPQADAPAPAPMQWADGTPAAPEPPAVPENAPAPQQPEQNGPELL